MINNNNNNNSNNNNSVLLPWGSGVKQSDGVRRGAYTNKYNKHNKNCNYNNNNRMNRRTWGAKSAKMGEV